MINRLFNFVLVKDSERKQLGYSFLVFLLIGMGMAMGRGTADALFFKRYGIEFLPPMYILLGVLLMAVSTLYAAMSDLVPSERFFKILLGSLSVLLVLNWILIATTDTTAAYPVYFLLYEIASELLLVHAALYLGQNYETLQAKRLYPLIFAGAQVGTIFGGIFLATAAPSIGVQNVLLVWSCILLLTLVVLTRHHNSFGVSPYFRPGRKSRARVKQSIEQIEHALKFLKKSELLKSMSIAFFFMVITFYVLSYSVNRIYTQSFSSEEELTAFYGTLVACTSVLGLLLQLFISGNAIRKFGVKTMNLLFPITTFICFIGLLFSPTVPAAILGSLNKDAIMPAFRTPVNNIFFNALPNYIQGRARAMSIALFLPLALILTGILLFVSQLIEDTRSFVLLGVITSFIYLYFNKRSNHAYVSGVLSILKDKVFLPDPHKTISVDANDKEIMGSIIQGVKHEDDDISLVYCKLLMSVSKDRVIDVILPRLETAGIKMIDQLINKLIQFNSEIIYSTLSSLMDRSDPHLRYTILMALIKQGKKAAIPQIKISIDSDNPRLCIAGVYGALTFSELNLRDEAYDKWQRLLNNKNDGATISGLTLLRIRPEIRFGTELVSCLESENDRVKDAALKALMSWPYEQPSGLLNALHNLMKHTDPFIREKVIKCTSLLPNKEQTEFIYQGLRDNHPGVRSASAEIMMSIDKIHKDQALDWIVDSAISPKAQEALLSALLNTSLNINQLREIAEAKANEAQMVAAAIHTLTRNHNKNKLPSSLQLLQTVLLERRIMVVNLFLSAMERIEDANVIDLIRSGLNSNDPRHVANAVEALRNTSKSQLTHPIIEILDDVSASRKTKKDKSSLFYNTHDVINWCLERRDPWLNDCAKYAMENINTAIT